jgi:hypothetical protein
MSSYSFSFVVPTKADAIARVSTEFDKHATEYPEDEVARANAVANAIAAINQAADDPAMDLRVSVNGFVSGPLAGGAFTRIDGVGITTNVALVERKA